MRSVQGIRRFWLLTSLTYYTSCMGTGTFMPFSEGYRHIQKQIQMERIAFLYQCGANHVPFDLLMQNRGITLCILTVLLIYSMKYSTMEFRIYNLS